MKWIEIDPLPPPFDNALEVLLSSLHWRKRTEDGKILVCLEEIYQGHKTAHVLNPRLVAKANDLDYDEAVAILETWMPQDHLTSNWRELYPYVQGLQQTGTMGEWFAAFQVAALGAPDAIFPSQMAHFFEGVKDSGFPEATLWGVQFESSFPTRLAGVRGLMNLIHAHETMTPGRFDGFQAARGLTGDIVGSLRSYLSPLLLGQAPFVLGITAGRANGTLIVNLGKPVEGIEGFGYSDLVHLFAPSGYLSRIESARTLERPPIDAPMIDDAIRWWLGKLDHLLGTLLDPTNFADSSNKYDVVKHFATLLSLDRFTATIAGILAYDVRDHFVRKMLLFDSLDLLEGLGRGKYERTLDPDKLRATVEEIRQAIPESVQAIVLPRCTVAIEKLVKLQEGFFIPERINEGRIRVNTKNGPPIEIALDKAAAKYLHIVRSSSHSFLGDITNKPQQLSLLTSHSGTLSHELADLPLIYFLEMLIWPSRYFGRDRRASQSN